MDNARVENEVMLLRKKIAQGLTKSNSTPNLVSKTYFIYILHSLITLILKYEISTFLLHQFFFENCKKFPFALKQKRFTSAFLGHCCVTFRFDNKPTE